MANGPNFKISQNIIFENIDGEVIMLNLDIGKYYSLHGLAAQIWGLIEKATATQKITEALAKHYQENPQQMGPKIREFLHELEKVSIIIPILDPNDTSIDENQTLDLTNLPTTFTQPELQTYSDMEKLLLIDPIHEVDSEGWPHRAPVTETEE